MAKHAAALCLLALLIPPAYADPVPHAKLERIVVDGVAYSARESLRLPPGAGQLEFQFTAPATSGGPAPQFRYTLEGFDRNWIFSGTRREADYTNIPHGRYRFRVCASNGKASLDDGDAIAVILQPYYWETLSFYLLAAMGLVGASGLAYAWKLNKTRTSQHNLLKLVYERTGALRESENQLRRSRDELEIRVHERTIELVRANQALEAEIQVRRTADRQFNASKESSDKASKAKTDLLKTMSHEIRTPAGEILKLCQTRETDDISEADRDYISAVHRAATSLLRIADAIFAFSTMEQSVIGAENGSDLPASAHRLATPESFAPEEGSGSA